MIKIFRSLIAIVVLVAIVYLVANYSGQLQQQIGIKGASTSRAQGITQQVLGDATSQVNSVKQQAMHINISDVMNYLSRFKKVPQDASSLKDYAQSQLNNVLKSKDKK